MRTISVDTDDQAIDAPLLCAPVRLNDGGIQSFGAKKIREMIGVICAANKEYGRELHVEQPLQPEPFARSVGLLDFFNNPVLRPLA